MNDKLGNTMIALYLLLGVVCVATSPHQVKSPTQEAAVKATDTSNITKGGSASPIVTGSAETPEFAGSNFIESEAMPSSQTSDEVQNRTNTSPISTAPVFEMSWWPFCIAALCIAVGCSVCMVKQPQQVYLGAGFAVSFFLFVLPSFGLSSFGLVGLLACFGFLIHFLVPKKLAEKSVFLGIALVFLAFAFAVAGGVAAHNDLGPFEQYSTALYEATQLPLMNMSPHDRELQPDSKFYFMWARIFGCLFAYFVAYKTVSYFCERAHTEFWLGWYCLRSSKKVAMVIGLGTIGRRLIRNLLAEGHRVIAIESDKDSVHIERAQALGAHVIVGDALDDRVFGKTPFDAVSSIYVVAGDDRMNLEISHKLLSYSIKLVKESNNAKSPDSPWWRRLSQLLLEWIFRNEEAVCHVQLYDSNTQGLMENEYYQQQVKQSHIEMRHFNAQQNAVQDLVQRELSKPEIRPQTENEVALYFIVGFKDLGQEVALGLAQLAHFDNLKKSRMVVFCSDEKTEAASFLARYPKFTATPEFCSNWASVKFNKQYDDWLEVVGETANATEGVDTSELATTTVVTVTAEATVTEGEAAGDQQMKAVTANESSECSMASSPNQSSEPDATRLEKIGATFATNAIFTRSPVSPSDTSFLEMIYRITQAAENIAVKPCVIVCEKDVSLSFQWSSEFTAAWTSFVKKKGLKPECPNGTNHPSLTTYFWLQGHKALCELSKDNIRHVPFGLEENCISTAILDANLMRKLASVVQHSYALATSSPKSGHKSEGLIEPIKLEFLKSNLHAAAHSLIKYRVAGGDLTSISAKEDTELPKIQSMESFPMNGYRYSDPNTVDENDEGILLKLGKMEHNRWMAEQLLKGYEFIEKEVDRVNNIRLPQHEHQRQTLCAWKHLSDKEKLKDLRQAYYVLGYLQKLVDSNGSGGRGES
jgi:hypothetical protein